MPARGEDVRSQYDKLERERAPHDARYIRMAPFIAPSRVGIGGYSPSDKQTTGVYDSTSMLGAELMAHFVAGHIINPGQRWFDYGMDPQPRVSPDGMDQIREWAQECRDRSLRRAAASMFYAEGAESMIDWGGFGTGCLIGEENPQPPNYTIPGFRGFSFRAERTGRFLMAEGVLGLVDTLYRKFELSARVIRDRWSPGNDNSEKLPVPVRKALAEGVPNKPFKIIHGIYPRSKGEQTYGALGMPWASCWVEYETKHLIHESGYRVFPVAVPRYHRTPEDVYGRGRGDLAFPDTWTLNTAKRMGLEDWALKIRPPILHGHDSVFGTLRLTPGGPTSVNTHGRPIRDSVMPFETGSHPEVSQIKEEELRKTIRQIFYVDHILALMEVNKSEMTAFEFGRKLALLFKLIGPVYGRVEWELLYQILEIMWDLQLNGGDFPPPPPAIQDTDGDIKLVFQNPLARAQRSEDAEALMMAVNDVAPFGQIDPDIFDWFDKDQVMQGIMSIRGVPAKWQNSPSQVKAIRQARFEQNQRQLQLEQAEQVAGAAGKAAPALKALQEAATAKK